MAYWKSDAICLRVLEYGETSLIATFLSPERGRVSCIAKGARGRGSRFFGELELLYRVELVCADRKRSPLHTLSELTVLDTHRGVRRSLDRLHAALYALELAERLAQENDPAPRLYELLARALDRLARNQGYNPLTVLIYELLALEAQGLGPSLERCADCGGPPERDGGPVWAPVLGGVACGACAPSDRDRMALGRRALEDLRALATRPEHAADLKPSPERVRALRALVDAFVAARLEQRLRMAPYVSR